VEGPGAALSAFRSLRQVRTVEKSIGNSRRGWIVAFTTFVTLGVVYGVWYSYSVFLVAFLREFGWKAFDLAERLQTPVFVLSDLDLGMNQWMTEPFRYPDTPMDRGKVLWEEDLEKLNGDWGRYRDVDGDGTRRSRSGLHSP
jgi:hypothetical protein